ncbi:MAG: hypothetical protein Q9174_003138 [Haloplaca sp. 1 TL-2023]
MAVVTDTYDAEFPDLKSDGLYASKTIGHGNCLFHALADQMYGDQSKHEGVRAAVIAAMREDSNYYKNFLAVAPGGGTRRNPKRKNAGAFASDNTSSSPTASEINAAFEGHLKRMAQGGTYGDNLEVQAATKAFNVDIQLYSTQTTYIIEAQPAGSGTKLLHIAYHDWEHYSSVRNLNGPHQGIPHTEPLYKSIETGGETKGTRTRSPYISEWKIDSVVNSVTDLTDRAVIRKKLEIANGNIDTVVSDAMDAQQTLSASGSSDGSSSIERERDSDDEDYPGPNKKQDRRLSKASRLAAKEKEDQRKHDLVVRMKDRQLSTTKESASPPVISVNDVKLHDGDDTEEEDWRNLPLYKDSESASGSPSASEYSAGGKSSGVRLILSQPKKEADKLQPPTKKPGHSYKGTARPAPIMAAHNTPVSSTSPRRRRLYRRNELDPKKVAQKANANERKKQNVIEDRAQSGTSLLPGGVKESTPAVESYMKTLCV